MKDSEEMQAIRAAALRRAKSEARVENLNNELDELVSAIMFWLRRLPIQSVAVNLKRTVTGVQLEERVRSIAGPAVIAGFTTDTCCVHAHNGVKAVSLITTTRPSQRRKAAIRKFERIADDAWRVTLTEDMDFAEAIAEVKRLG